MLVRKKFKDKNDFIIKGFNNLIIQFLIVLCLFIS